MGRASRFRVRWRRAAGATLLAAAYLIFVSAPSGAATITVCASGCDHTTIQAAIDAAAAGDTITVDDAVYPEALTIIKNLTIQGAGTSLLSATPTFVGFVAGPIVTVGSGVTVDISDLDIVRATSGGGVSNAGTLTLTRVLVNSNLNTANGAGISTTGGLTVVDSQISSNTTSGSGGGIYADDAAVVVRGSSINLNAAGVGGGGISGNGGSLRVETSSIGNNRALITGGGVEGFDDLTIIETAVQANTLTSGSATGGGVYTHGGTTTLIQQSEVSGNTAAFGGGAYLQGISSTVENSTFSGNQATSGGGAYLIQQFNVSNVPAVFDSVTAAANTASSLGAGFAIFQSALMLDNTIVADNVTATECYVHGNATVTASTANIIETITSCAVGGTSPTTGDPNLGSLAVNGAATQTHALLPGSSAINTGATSLTADQRGISRPQEGIDDIGAFESEPLVNGTTTTTTTTTSTSTSTTTTTTTTTTSTTTTTAVPATTTTSTTTTTWSDDPWKATPQHGSTGRSLS